MHAAQVPVICFFCFLVVSDFSVSGWVLFWPQKNFAFVFGWFVFAGPFVWLIIFCWLQDVVFLSLVGFVGYQRDMFLPLRLGPCLNISWLRRAKPFFLKAFG